jgi:hypothetical protein
MNQAARATASGLTGPDPRFYESRFIAENPVGWQRETYFLEKEKIKSIHLDSDKKEN